MKKVMVIGSSNTDMVVRSARIPVPGETILVSEYCGFIVFEETNQPPPASRLLSVDQ